jgi:thioredoxin-related protein
MKNYLIILFCFLGVQLIGQSQISFVEGTWEEVLEKAKEENKIIFVDVYATWCGPCKMMAKEVFTQQEVADFHNATFINAKFDADTEIGGAVANQFEVSALPTFLYVDASGALVSKTLGYQEADLFMENGRKASVIAFDFAEYQVKYELGYRSPEFMAKYLDLLNTKGETDACRGILGEMIAKDDSWKTAEIMDVYVSIMEPADYDDLFVYFLNNQNDFKAFVDKDRMESVIANYVVNKTYETATDMKDMAEQAEVLFNKYIPENATKFSSFVWISYYESEEDWDNYIIHVDKYLNAAEANEYELNAFAWNIYMNVDNSTYLEKGLEMALQSVEIEAQFANTDTVAALYYKLGNKKKAKKYARMAIDMGVEEGADVSDTEALLDKISAM